MNDWYLESAQYGRMIYKHVIISNEVSNCRQLTQLTNYSEETNMPDSLQIRSSTASRLIDETNDIMATTGN